MTQKSFCTTTEIRYLWRTRGNKNYELKCLNSSGDLQSIIFEDVRNRREVSGKLVASPHEGEAYHWPRLQHENLAPLLDIVSINEKVSVYISTVLKNNLKYIIHEDEFLQAPTCFDRKKSYVLDILLGLDYLHDRRLCLMNLNEANIYINAKDNAVISDFSRLMLAERATKLHVAVPDLYRAPELNDHSSGNFNAMSAEMWACGVMLLQIFTGHMMPSTFNDDVDSKFVIEVVSRVNQSILVQNNKGAYVAANTSGDFQTFLGPFLCLVPNNRISAKNAAISHFLGNPRRIWVFEKLYNPSTITEHLSENESEVVKQTHLTNHAAKANSFVALAEDAAKNRANLRRHYPSNKFFNLEYDSSDARLRKEDKNSSFPRCSKSNWNISPISNKCKNDGVKKKQTNSSCVASDKREIPVPQMETIENIYSMNENKNSNSHHEIDQKQKKLDMNSEEATSTSIKMNTANTNLKTTENTILANEKDLNGCPKINNPETSSNLDSSLDISEENEAESLKSAEGKNDFERHSMTEIRRRNSDSNINFVNALKIFPQKSDPRLNRHHAYKKTCLKAKFYSSLSTYERNHVKSSESTNVPRLFPILDTNHEIRRPFKDTFLKEKILEINRQNSSNNIYEDDKLDKSTCNLRDTPSIIEGCDSRDQLKLNTKSLNLFEENIVTECSKEMSIKTDYSTKDSSSIHSEMALFESEPIENCTFSRRYSNGKTLPNEFNLTGNNLSSELSEQFDFQSSCSGASILSQGINLRENNSTGIEFTNKLKNGRSHSYRCAMLQGFNLPENNSKDIESPKNDGGNGQKIPSFSAKLMTCFSTVPKQKIEYEESENTSIKSANSDSYELSKNGIGKDQNTTCKFSANDNNVNAIINDLENSYSEIPLHSKNDTESIEYLTERKKKKKERQRNLCFRYLCPGSEVYSEGNDSSLEWQNSNRSS